MTSSVVLQLLGLAVFASLLQAHYDNENHLVMAPQSPVVQIGANFTATCVIVNTTEATADDLYWNLSKSSLVPREYYRKINASALAVTFPVRGEESEWLFCLCRKDSFYVALNPAKFTNGIYLKKAYGPSRAENLSCMAEQQGDYISPEFSCRWDADAHETEDVRTEHNLMVRASFIEKGPLNTTTFGNTASVSWETFPLHNELEVWVLSRNPLGTVESQHLRRDAADFVKTSPPDDVTPIAEERFPTSLLVKWKHPIHETTIKLTFEIRYCQNGSHAWSSVQVPPTSGVYSSRTSFRLQKLQPAQAYVIQMRCKKHGSSWGYWSSWTDNVTVATAEDRPQTKPDVWRLSGSDAGEVLLVSKDPQKANGRITTFGLKLQYGRNGSVEQEAVPRQSPEITVLKRISLAERRSVRVCVNASTAVGTSPEACLFVAAKPPERMEQPKVWVEDGRMLVEWTPPDGSVTEYVVEWSRPGETDWQRENATTSRAAIKGSLEPFVRYNVSVYAVRSGWVWKAARQEAFLQQGAPSHGPSITKSSPGYDHAELTWDQIPPESGRGFITNYTIFYRKEQQLLEPIPVPANRTSYTLTKLTGNTKYDVWIRASTAAGSANGTHHSFTTVRYAPGMVEGIVVGVSLGFLFLLLMTLLLCVLKKDVIKENLWPRIPDPGESTIGTWSPGYPVKAESPQESCVSGVCVLDVGVSEVKLGLDEDKSSLSLRKEYRSEEHSSGIGGSSCMSSPRHSVSDSDEGADDDDGGADPADSTAGTVQYSSVVAAASGYKGQTPAAQRSVFSRSESTQPLLDSEEPPDGTPRPSLLGAEPHDFQPLAEDGEPDEATSAAASSYMPQLAAYRPQ